YFRTRAVGDGSSYGAEKTFTTPGQPDLTVTEKHEEWVQPGVTYRVFFTIKNQGTANASAGHDVALTIDANSIEQKPVPVELAPGATYSGNFTTLITLSGLNDSITVAADVNSEVDESDETNNLRSNTWSVPVGTISGRLYQSDNITPIVGAQIDVFSYASITGAPTSWVSYGGNQTAADGSYRVFGLPAGQYGVRVMASGRATQWYNNVNYRQQSTAVSVTANNDTPNINFNLGLAGSISGRVYQSDNITPIANLTTAAYNAITGGFSIVFTTTNSSGDYTLAGLPAGNYNVRTFSSLSGLTYADKWYNNKLVSTQANPVSVTVSTDTPNINFSLEVGGTISGRVYQSDNITPIAGAAITVYDYATLSGTLVRFGGATTAADGSYRTPNFSNGQYGVQVIASGYATQWYNNVHYRQQATAVSITAPNDTPNINFSLGPGGSISGRIYQADNITPIANLNLYAQSVTTGLSDGVNTNSAGNYTISGLPPGSYRVKTNSPYTGLNYIDKWYNNKSSQSAADPVSVTASTNTPNINFSLEPGGSISGTVLDQATGLPLNDASSGNITLTAGWHKFVYRQQEREGGQSSRAAFKAPGDTAWRWFSTSELEIRTSANSSAQSGLWLTNKKFTWTYHPRNHVEMVTSVDTDATTESGWYGSSVVSIVNQDNNIHGNDDYYTSYYEGYFYVNTPGTWQFSTDSDDASEIVIDTQVVAYWYNGHGAAGRWEHKVDISLYQSGTNTWINSTRGNADGSYVFTSIPTGNYTVQAASSGYVTEWYNNKNSQSGADTVLVTAPNDTPGINISLEAMVPKPDLTIVEKHEEWVQQGVSYRVFYTVQNIGTANASAGHDVSLTIDGSLIEQKPVPVILIPGAIYSDNFTTVITVSGSNDSITVTADSNTEVDEADEANNSRTNTWPPKPDLTITDRHEVWVVPGVSYTVSYTIKNQGTLAAPAGHDIALQVDGKYLEFKPLPVSLAPNAAYTDNFTTVVTLSGSYDNVTVVADFNNEVDESSELNNRSGYTLAWPAAPDLAVNTSTDEWVVPGSQYKVRFGIRNSGNAAASANHSAALTIDGVEVERKQIPVSLASGQSYSDTFNTTTNLTGSMDKIVVTADIGNVVAESNETNNSFTQTFAWPQAPDLTVNFKAEQWLAGSTTQYNVYFEIRNIGNAPAVAGHDVELKVDGNVTGTMPIPLILNQGNVYWGVFSANITISGSSDNITLTADINNEVAEGDETNNSRTNSWSAPAPPPPTGWQTVRSPTDILADVTFIDANNGWAVGSSGIIQRTSNGGAAWTSQNSGTTADLWSVSFADANNGWAVGNSGTIRRTLDGGATWTSQTSGVGNSLYGVSFVDASNGWAVGSGGTIRYTSNGGANWTSQTSNTTNNLNSVSFVNASTGWIVASGGVILNTSNGGNTWTVQSSNPAFFLNNVSFVDALNGWITLANSTSILHTSNGGTSWAFQTSNTTNLLNSVSFVDANNGWAVGQSGTILHTTNGGANWTSQTSNTTANLIGVSAFSANQSWAVGDSMARLYTTNGGSTWTVQNQAASPSYLIKAVDFITPLEGWAGVSSPLGKGFQIYTNVIMHTLDGGTTWTAQNVGLLYSYQLAIDFTDASNGWAVGYWGNIIHTSNGGATWMWQTSNSTNHLYGVKFADANNGWAVGSLGTILRTSNSGANWTSQTSGTTNSLYGVKFIDTSNGWAVGNSGTIRRTFDGGNTWINQTSNTTNALYSVSFVDANNGWAVGSSGIVRRTSDGGSTWTSQTSGVSNSLYSVSFVDTNNGWAVGYGGTVRHTSDGGSTWIGQTSSTTNTLRGISATDSGRAWAVGDYGIIIRYQTTAPPPSKADLVIVEKHESWVQAGTSYTVGFTIKNNGGTTVPAGQDVSLLVDGALIESKPVPVSLAPGANYTDYFTTMVNLSGGSDIVIVSADINNEADESNETNNSLLNIWPSPGAGVQVRINAPAKVAANRDFTARVEISQVQSLDAANFDVSFNPAVLRLDKVTNGNISGITVPVDAWNLRQSGRFSVAVNIPGLTGVNGSGSLATLHFHVLGANGTSSNIILSSGVLSNSLAQEIAATWIGDSVEVGIIPGDATGDGLVNALDITKVERIIARLDSSTPGADANLDGNVNALDITKVERIIVGLDDGPVGASLPRYGSILTAAITGDPSTFDSGTSSNSGGALVNTVYEQYMSLDWRRGPAGSGVSNLAAGASSLEDNYGPHLSTNWTMPEPGVWILQIRQGVNWALDPTSEASRLVGGRELTADDVV
ncbi:MAG: CARDB domain-containing protein, partial [Chloroflexota bacterium]